MPLFVTLADGQRLGDALAPGVNSRHIVFPDDLGRNSPFVLLVGDVSQR